MHGGVKCGGWLAAGEQERYAESMCGDYGSCEGLKVWWYECVGYVRCECVVVQLYSSGSMAEGLRGAFRRDRCQPGCLARVKLVEVDTGFEKRIG
jgi:hypothetical protein